MLRCKVFKFLFSALPLKSWQARLLDGHLESCVSCRGELAKKTEARDVLRRELSPRFAGDMWPLIRKGIEEERPIRLEAQRHRWQWVLGTAAASAVLFLVVWFGVRDARFVKTGGGGEAGGFLINSISVGGEPATTFFYHPTDSDMILVWAEKEL